MPPPPAAEAEAVDRDARFPQEAIDAARQQQLLGVQIPLALGGDGASISDITDMCYPLAPSLLIHRADLRHASDQGRLPCAPRRGTRWSESLMRRVAADQLLLASSTTEGQDGGNVRSRPPPSSARMPEISLVRNATVISYGAEADGIVTTARRAADAAGSDQVLLAIMKEDYTLEPSLAWDTLGMRGTCSEGFHLARARLRGANYARALRENSRADHGAACAPAVVSVWAGHRRRRRRQGAASCAMRCAIRAGSCPREPRISPRRPLLLRALRGCSQSLARGYEAA